MKEVEIKIRIDGVEGVLGKLEKVGIGFGEAVEQNDVIYIPQTETLLPVGPGVPVLRLRQEQGKVKLTLKKSDPNNHLAKTEKETEVNDGKIFDEIFRLLNFKEVVRINKKRRKGFYNGMEFCLDEVEGLGTYLEMEKMTDEEPGQVQEQMLQFLSKIGIDISQREKFGYDILYAQKYGEGKI